jgi:hypothetical protein
MPKTVVALLLSNLLTLGYFLPAKAQLAPVPAPHTSSNTVPLTFAAPLNHNTSSASSPSSTVVINSQTSLSNLVVTPKETVAIDFGKLGTQGVNLSGILNNAGTIYAFSTNPSVTTAHISANSIINNHSAVISSIIPKTELAVLNLNTSSVVQNLGLSLNSLHALTNLGTISSAGSLTATAANFTNSGQFSSLQNLSINASSSLANTGTISSAAGGLSLSAPAINNADLILAQGGNISAVTANLTNQSGVMQAMNGQLNIQGLPGLDLNINNSNGKLLATDISVSTDALLSSNLTGTAQAPNLNLIGGELTANSVNFTATGGNVNVNVDRINGGVNVNGANGAVIVQNGALNITSENLSKDPIFASANGPLNLTLSFDGNGNDFTNGDQFVALSGGDVTVTNTPANGGVIDTSSSTHLLLVHQAAAGMSICRISA